MEGIGVSYDDMKKYYILNNMHVSHDRYEIFLMVPQLVRIIDLVVQTSGIPYPVHISPLHVCIMIQVIPIHIFKTHFLKFTLSLILSPKCYPFFRFSD